MKKMLAKAIALSVIVGGMSFVTNDAQAAIRVVTNREGWMNTAPIRHEQAYELVEKKDINGIEQKAEAAKQAADQAKNAVKKEEAERKDADKEIKGKIEKVEADSKAADKKLDEKIEKETDARKEADKKLDKKIEKETDARKEADKKLDKKIDKEAEARKEADEAEKQARIAADEAEKQARIEADEKEAATRAAEDQRIEAKFDGEVARLDSRIDKLDKKIEKVGAMAAAIANLHTMGYDPAAPTEIAVGVGQYRDKTGVALGAFHYPNRDFMLSFSVSTAGDEYMGGIGATWKFGRKTPEEMRQAEHEKAVKAKVAKAEAAKKAAKDARVAAQQQRHAEMLAARTAK